MSATSSSFSAGFMPAAGSSSKQQARLGGQAAHDFEAALFTVREAAGLDVAGTQQMEEIEQLVHPASDGRFVLAKCASPDEGLPGTGRPMQIAGRANVLEDREAPEEPDVLKRAGDAEAAMAWAGNPARSRRAGECSGGRRIEAGDQVEDGRLAGAVGADQADKLPRQHVEVEGVDRHRPPKRTVTRSS